MCNVGRQNYIFRFKRYFHNKANFKHSVCTKYIYFLPSPIFFFLFCMFRLNKQLTGIGTDGASRALYRKT